MGHGLRPVELDPASGFLQLLLELTAVEPALEHPVADDGADAVVKPQNVVSSP